ncbi:exoribonuclease II [Methanocella paludicola SANAE]|uniref:Exoribonuclease II n=1 Tax=Methanocella paludicola (strain DSM 17711 / JCM 13418 / NBRC 101707 / SANAE) TaxID=304371 RepID=D1YYD5_METPS|nr:RNB domain-containing ribonuclease [Methanocella paludicola]BAI61457.1 exoribonuclease II [Methanocella paludicola SANAE]
MTNIDDRHHRSILKAIAHRAMLERGLDPDFPAQALAELDRINGPATQADASTRDLRNLIWCSIDNDDSLDLDQLTVAEAMPTGAVKIRVAIADVDAVVRKRSAIDDHARQNTTSVYTVAETFPMLPEKLSTDLTSLNYGSDRLAVVIEMVFAADGSLRSSDIYRAMVRNHAKLAYNSVAGWLEGTGPMPQGLDAVDGLRENLRLQDRVAQTLKSIRYKHGALELETIEARPVFVGEELKGLVTSKQNRAQDLIAEFMIAANGVVARYLDSKNFPVLQRVVRKPKRWDRIVGLAAERGSWLPRAPDSKALEQFLATAKAQDPLRFPDLSLSVIKLLGSGEYMVQLPGEDGAGHFGLAVKDYAHSTAPNRRYPDLITQRLLKAAISGVTPPYDHDELEALAAHCTEEEDEATKVERQVRKSAAALLLRSRVGEQFDAFVTGATDHGTWVRILDPPVEGKLEHGFEGVDVGCRIRVQLIGTDVERGFIDFKRIKKNNRHGR